MSAEITHVVGAFLIQAEGAFLNGAGLDSFGEGDITIPKTVQTINENGRSVPMPYVSAQSWKRWLRDTFIEENSDEFPNYILTIDVNKQGNTNKVGADPDPIKFAEADIFGYMKTEKNQGKKKKTEDEDDETENEEEEQIPEENNTIKKGKEKVKPVMRTSPFQSSILLSLRKTGWEGIDKGYVHPKGLSEELKKKNPEANPTSLPYTTRFYNTQLQGIFGLAYSRLGVFRCEGDRIELSNQYQELYKDRFIKDETSLGVIFTLKDNPRKNRAEKILKSLAIMRGGAKQAQFGTPVHPQVLIMAGLKSGNLIFNSIFEDSVKGPKIKLNTLKEIIKDFDEKISTKIYIGIRTGYLDPNNENELREWAKSEKDTVIICTPVEAANKISQELPE